MASLNDFREKQGLGVVKHIDIVYSLFIFIIIVCLNETITFSYTDNTQLHLLINPTNIKSWMSDHFLHLNVTKSRVTLVLSITEYHQNQIVKHSIIWRKFFQTSISQHLDYCSSQKVSPLATCVFQK